MLSPYVMPGLIERPAVPGRQPSLEEIIVAVCDHTRIPASEIGRKVRHPEYVQARQFVCYLTRKLNRQVSLKQIGRRLGGQDHTTVIHSVHQIQNLLDTEDDMRETVEYLIMKIQSNK